MDFRVIVVSVIKTTVVSVIKATVVSVIEAIAVSATKIEVALDRIVVVVAAVFEVAEVARRRLEDEAVDDFKFVA